MKQQQHQIKLKVYRYREQRWEWGAGKMDEGRSKVQASSHQISPGRETYSMATIVNSTVFHIWNLLRKNLVSSHHKKKKISVCVMTDVN